MSFSELSHHEYFHYSYTVKRSRMIAIDTAVAVISFQRFVMYLYIYVYVHNIMYTYTFKYVYIYLYI
jgi:hypothetical protein